MTPEREAQLRAMFESQWPGRTERCADEPETYAHPVMRLYWDGWLACARALEPKWVDAADQDPPDAEPVLVSGFAYNNPKYARTYGVAFYSEGVWVSDEDGKRIHTPTHWMPLPEQPTAAMSAALEDGNATE